jgi:GDP-D-mannose 3',5'-epimerase
MRKNILVLGSRGFIGANLVNKLKREGHFVVGADINDETDGNEDEFHGVDLSGYISIWRLFQVYQYEEIYQLAADMGGAGYIFTGENDANIMQNSASINLSLLHCLIDVNYKGKVFYSSSACVYPEHLQLETANNGLKESDAYPANPDSNYGWEKLFSERLYMAYAKNHDLDVRIARFHNIFGEYSTYKGGKEKAPAAICRKVAEAENGSQIEIWGSGEQTRSFLYIDECLEGVERLMESNQNDILNIGSSEAISINDLAKMVIEISGKDLKIKNIESNAIGVNGRNSDNALCGQALGWKPSQPLRTGMERLYKWVNEQVAADVATNIIAEAISEVNGTEDDLNRGNL